MDGKKTGSLLSLVAAVAVLFVAGGCTSMNATLAGEKVSAGEKAVADAREGSAILNAPDDLATAQGKLAQAKEAFSRQNYEEAARLADQASVHADYARARATTQQPDRHRSSRNDGFRHRYRIRPVHRRGRHDDGTRHGTRC